MAIFEAEAAGMEMEERGLDMGFEPEEAGFSADLDWDAVEEDDWLYQLDM
jgi:hypothetical protein